MRPDRRVTTTLLALLALPFAPMTLAGELDPPPGAVAPTMKDLDDVEPRAVLRNDFDTLTPIAITQPGSYKLGENIDALPGQSGITISASNVTLDLNGFEVRGNLEVGSVNGILITGERDSITIRNGTVFAFQEIGIRGETADGVTVEDVKLRLNSLGGLVLRFGATVTRCTAQENAGSGMGVGGNATFTDCIAFGNGGEGIIMGGVSTARGCTAYLNGDNGIRAGTASSVTNCAAFQNDGTGISASQHCTITNCTSTENGEHGFTSTNACVFESCVASINTMDGFRLTQSLARGCVTNANGGMAYNNVVGSTVIDSIP